LPAVLPPELRPILLLTIITLSGLFNSSAGVLWVSWMGDVVPTGERGRFLGFRSGALGVIAMLANLGAGALIDRIARPLGFQIVMGAATVLGAISALILIAHIEPRTPQPRNDLKATLLEPFADPNFRRVLLFAVYWTFSVMIAAPFVIPYFLQQLPMSYTQIAILSVSSAAARKGTP
jgi:MFS family permease